MFTLGTLYRRSGFQFRPTRQTNHFGQIFSDQQLDGRLRIPSTFSGVFESPLRERILNETPLSILYILSAISGPFVYR